MLVDACEEVVDRNGHVVSILYYLARLLNLGEILDACSPLATLPI